MNIAYVGHILAGSLGLLFGYVSLYSAKGAPLHRRSGMLFVYTMIPMALFGITMAAVRGVAPALNIPAGLLTAYLVITALTTVRPLERGSQAFDATALLLALAVGMCSIKFGFDAVVNGGTRNGMPAFPFFMFGIVGLIASAGDARMLRSGALTGGKRLARHLWRMSFGLFIAAMSFFIGQAGVIPKPLRIRPLLAMPVLAVLVTMLWWLWRVRIRRTFQRMVRVRAPVASG